MPLALAVLQLAAATAPAEPPIQSSTLPTIELHARVRAKELTVSQQGEVRLEVYAAPALEETVKVRRNQPKGQQRYRDLDLTLDARATLGDPPAAPQAAEPGGETSEGPVQPPDG